MKLNSTVVLTFILLFLMLGSGVASGMGGFVVGRAALKGVTQPEVRPTNKLTRNKRSVMGKDQVEILREQDILATVKAQINAKPKAKSKSKNKDKSKTSSESTTDKNSREESTNSTKSASSQLEFPLRSKNQGVTMEVRNARTEGGSLLLNVSLKNQGSRAVRFLYSFLNVTDDGGHTLSASTEGLPGELPANGQEFSGTVSIPTAMLEDAKKLSLTLKDYPEQKLQLQLDEIPVER